MPKITTPVKGFTGTVAGVSFANGVGETEDPTALGYFSRRGYKVEDEKPAKKAPAPKAPATPKAPAAPKAPAEPKPAGDGDKGEKPAE